MEKSLIPLIRIFFTLVVITVCAMPVYGQTAAQFTELAIKQVLSGNYAEAVSNFDLAISLDPSVARVYASKANALNKLGQIGDACHSANIALEIDPNERLAIGVLNIIGRHKCDSIGNDYSTYDSNSLNLVERRETSILDDITSTLTQVSNAMRGCDPGSTQSACDQEVKQEYDEQTRALYDLIDEREEDQKRMQEEKKVRDEAIKAARQQEKRQYDIQAIAAQEQNRLRNLRNTYVLRAYAGSRKGSLTSKGEICKKGAESCKQKLEQLVSSAIEECSRETVSSGLPRALAGLPVGIQKQFATCSWSFKSMSRLDSANYGAIARARSSQEWISPGGRRVPVKPFVWGAASSDNPDKSSSRAINRCRVNLGSSCFVEHDWVDESQ